MIEAMSDEQIISAYGKRGKVRRALLSVAASESAATNGRVERLCGLHKKDRMAVLLETYMGPE